ncbi:MAG: acyl-CoA reductase [Chitinophagales bacterium]|nr:acyl-CoA reductase [Chitinophagales bacterium]
MIEAKINHLHNLKLKLSDKKELDKITDKVSQSNRWFNPYNVRFCLDHILSNYLDRDKLSMWLEDYELSNWKSSDKCVGQIMAGNIPLVGLHDFICAYVLDFKQEIKLSSKDHLLFSYIYQKLSDSDPELGQRVQIVDKLKNFDCVIATGSNNSNRYFEYYFRDKPKVLRKNRNSVAVIDGSENKADLQLLSEDIFRYFGLGCRSVSKIYLPEKYDLAEIIDQTDQFSWMKDHSSYMHNFDYNLSLLILNSRNYLANEFSIWVEDQSLASPLATVHYEYYTDKDALLSELSQQMDDIQCLVGKKEESNVIAYGNSQKPSLSDYADNVDIIEFLIKS